MKISLRIFFALFFAAFFLPLSAHHAEDGMDCYEVNDVFFNEAEFFGPALDKLLADGLAADEADDEKTELQDEIIDYAKGFLGTRYRRGGKNPKGFDCSGFTSYVFRKFGYSLGPASYLQGTQGEKVDETLDAQPGDLIFFSGSRKSSRVGHVGMVVDVDRDNGTVSFIHASIQKGVVIDQYPDGGYYSHRFIGVRRVL